MYRLVEESIGILCQRWVWLEGHHPDIGGKVQQDAGLLLDMALYFGTSLVF